MVDRELTEYMSGAIAGLIKSARRSAAKNYRETAFLLRYTLSGLRAGAKRRSCERRGVHIPPFLIASITASCNLHCAGCYARANSTCSDSPKRPLLSAKRWGAVFSEAAHLGIGFILLAGGEPLLRREVLTLAARRKDIVFPVFTNGTVCDAQALRLFDRHRNLVPVLSIEGGREITDTRRGEGTYDRIIATMRALREKRILFGASITVTTENLRTVSGEPFITALRKNGCAVAFFVEYVPADGQSEFLAPADPERDYLERRQNLLREQYPDMIFLSFPGDERHTGGCLAAGRGFFHINPYGGAEPCPFSPFSDVSVERMGLLEALSSPLFTKLKARGLVGGEHTGGCALFEREQEVRDMCRETE